jgi:hypothetical protein
VDRPHAEGAAEQPAIRQPEARQDRVRQRRPADQRHRDPGAAPGKLSGKPGDKFTTGRLGSYTVVADGVVVLGPPFVFNAGNIDQFDF